MILAILRGVLLIFQVALHDQIVQKPRKILHQLGRSCLMHGSSLLLLVRSHPLCFFWVKIRIDCWPAHFRGLKEDLKRVILVSCQCDSDGKLLELV